MSIFLSIGCLPMISFKLSKSVLWVYFVNEIVFSIVSVFSFIYSRCKGVFPLFRFIWCIDGALDMAEDDLTRFLGALGSELWVSILVSLDLSLFPCLLREMFTSSRKFCAVIGMVSSPSGLHSNYLFNFLLANTSVFKVITFFWVAEVARLSDRFLGDCGIITVPSSRLSKVTSATWSLIYLS